MLNKLLAAAAIAAIAYAIVPANAAKVSAGCSSANLGKTETSVEAMADGDGNGSVHPARAKSAKTTPCTVEKALICLMDHQT